jgi:hypothetical protein
MKRTSAQSQHALTDEAIAPVTILDSHGNVMRVVTASEFRRSHSAGEDPAPATAAPDPDRRAVRRGPNGRPAGGARKSALTITV